MSKVQFGNSAQTVEGEDRVSIFYLDYSWPYKVLLPLLKMVIPGEYDNVGVSKVTLTPSQLVLFKSNLEDEMLVLIKANQAKGNRPVGVILPILGIDVNLNLKDSDDKLIHSFSMLHGVIRRCIERSLEFDIYPVEDAVA